MKCALNQATLNTTSCEQFFNAAGDAKFDGVEVRQTNIASYLNSAEDASYIILREALASNQLEVAAVNALEFFNLCEDLDFKKIITPQAQFMCEIAYKLESNLIIVVPSFLPEGADPVEVRQDKLIQKTQDRLRKVAKIAQEQDVRVGFEFLGFPTNSVNNLILARQIVEPLYSTIENVGFVIDTFHFLVGGCKIDDLKGLESLFMVHVNDLPFSPGDDLSEKKDADRVFPGEGNFDFMSFSQALADVHFKEWVSVELFDEKLYSQPAIDVAQKAKESLQVIP
ncbi:MAG TPA: sugar phosphate isomerase/epimerase [Candidatus Lokiarchaeia archaeon]|nr:sugar phosphate isomerase/epimerase [Candidatus Lokiarchaeia archaeon]